MNNWTVAIDYDPIDGWSVSILDGDGMWPRWHPPLRSDLTDQLAQLQLRIQEEIA